MTRLKFKLTVASRHRFKNKNMGEVCITLGLTNIKSLFS